MSNLEGKKILVGVTASISAYKAVSLCRLLIKAGAEVQVIMTPSATSFVGPLTFSALTKKPCLVDYQTNNHDWNNHVKLGLWADVFVIAPASANTIAKAASGLCDNLLMATYLSCRGMVLFCPAMDLDMFAHPSTQANLEKLESYGNVILPPAEGELASGLSGPGRLQEPELIVSVIDDLLALVDAQDGVLAGKKVLITSGPTQEPIDPIRYITNHSSGKMGASLAKAARDLGAEVYVVSGPVQVDYPRGVEVYDVLTAQEMLEKVSEHFESADIVIMAAAVADYRFENPSSAKVKRNEEALMLKLVPNPDIAAWAGTHKEDHQILVGFALETDEGLESAKKKLKNKRLDWIVLNQANAEAGSGFGVDTNQVTIIGTEGIATNLPLSSKVEIARGIFDFILDQAGVRSSF